MFVCFSWNIKKVIFVVALVCVVKLRLCTCGVFVEMCDHSSGVFAVIACRGPTKLRSWTYSTNMATVEVEDVCAPAVSSQVLQAETASEVSSFLPV